MKETQFLGKGEMSDVAGEFAELAAMLAREVQGEVRFDGWSRMLYSTDASLYQIQPVGVVLPRSVADMQASMEIAARHRVPVLGRGGGSSLAGQAVGAALVLDTSKYMNRILGIDVEARTATVEPGITVAALNRALAPLGLMLGPDPASADRATIGGCVGNNSSGSHSTLYGLMVDHIQSIDTILADGSRETFAPISPEHLPTLARRDGLAGEIYRQIPQLIASVGESIISRFPKHWRRTSGYNLDRVLPPLLPHEERRRIPTGSRFPAPLFDPAKTDRFNLAHLLTGSEGTLALTSAITVNLVERPKLTACAVVHFRTVVEACTAVVDILETHPSACELLDKQLLDLARLQPKWRERITFVEGNPGAILITEFYGDSQAHLTAQMEHLERRLRQRGWTGAILRIADKARQEDIWAVRKAGLNILSSRRGDYKPVPGIEDVSVPAEFLAEYIGRVLAWCKEEPALHDVEVYAHASAGCLHVRPVANVKEAEGVAVLERMAEFALGLCLEYAGAMSGEHGDGLARSALNERLFGSELYGVFQSVKRTFDPDNLLNPGKIVNAPPLTANLRMGADYLTVPLQTVFDWSDDYGSEHGFDRAIEMCNGSGVCRKVESGVMCPSYMATRDERDSTRGRANALRNALAGRIPTEELFTPEMNDVLDLCLGCKACSSECPSSVDMARIKAEYLVHYYRRNGLPLFNRLMGMLPDLNALLFRTAARLVPAVNAALRSPFVRKAQSVIGVHPQRTLPTYARRSLADEVIDDTHPDVILFHDTWVNYNEPGIGRSALRVLRAAGYRVALARGRKCCGRPLLTGGQADKARAWVDHNVALLAAWAQAGIPIVGIEPSCILTLRDEYPALASDRKRAQMLASAALTFEEFALREVGRGRFAAKWRTEPGKALLHGHCHTRAIVGNEPALRILRYAGYTVEVVDSGCCGMAGDFGYEVDHYEVSRKIAEDRLIPAVRKADAATVIVASGTSCRHQIHDFGERTAVHLVEALEMALFNP